MLEIYIHMHSFDARLNSWSKKQDCSNLHKAFPSDQETVLTLTKLKIYTAFLKRNRLKGITALT